MILVKFFQYIASVFQLELWRKQIQTMARWPSLQRLFSVSVERYTL